MSEIKWQDPAPARGGGREDWIPIADALRNKPGTWALVKAETTSASTAVQIKQGRIRAFTPGGSFEAVSRTTDDGKYNIFARYVGEDGAA